MLIDNAALIWSSSSSAAAAAAAAATTSAASTTGEIDNKWQQNIFQGRVFQRNKGNKRVFMAPQVE